MPVDDAGPLRTRARQHRGTLGVIATGTAASGPVLNGLRAAAREDGYALVVFSVPGRGRSAVAAAVAGLRLQGVAGGIPPPPPRGAPHPPRGPGPPGSPPAAPPHHPPPPGPPAPPRP